MLTTLLLPGCVLPITRTDHVIVVAAKGRSPDCSSVAELVREVALSLGYTPVPVSAQSGGSIRIIASYWRSDRDHILLYLWNSSCVVHADELQRTIEAFRARGVAVSIEERKYPDVIELVSYAP